MNAIKTDSLHASHHISLHVTTNSLNRGERGATSPANRDKLEETVLLYPAILTITDSGGEQSTAELITLAEALQVIRAKAEEVRYGDD